MRGFKLTTLCIPLHFFFFFFGPCFSGCLFLFLPILPFSLGNFKIKLHCIRWIFTSHKGKKNTLQQLVSTKVSESKSKRKFIQNERNKYKGKKKKRGNLYKMKRNLQNKIAYQIESLN